VDAETHKEHSLIRRTMIALVLAAIAPLAVAGSAEAATAVHHGPVAAAIAHAPEQVLPGAVWQGEYTIANEAASKCLDADATAGGVNGNKIQIWDCNVQAQQSWTFWETSPGSQVFYITNARYPSKCLDMDLNTFPSDGTKVQLWDCNYQKQQLFYLPWMDASGRTLGFHQFTANAATRFVLDADNSHGLANGSKVQLWENLSGKNQFWHIWPSG
jgi:hypothetical protein